MFGSLATPRSATALAMTALTATLTIALALVTPVPAGAAERGVEVGWVESYPINATVHAYFDFVVSGDLTTAAMAGCDDPSVVFVDLSTGSERVVTGSPEGGCASFPEEDTRPPGDRGPAAAMLVDMTVDGRALVSAPWEGVASGDADDGATDAFVVNGSTGERLLLSAGVSGDVQGIAISAEGNRAVLMSTDGAGNPVGLFRWDRATGTLTPIAHPDLSSIDWHGGGGSGTNQDTPISDDGRYLFTPMRDSTLLRIDLDSGATTTIAMNAACCGIRQYAVSSDGGTAAWFSTGSDPNNIFTREITIWTPSKTSTFPFATTNAQTSSIHVAAGKVFGTAREFGGNEPLGYRFWSIEIASGVQTILIDEGRNAAPAMRAEAVSADGRSAIISTMGPNGYRPADPRIVQGGRIAFWQYRWDADLTAPGRPGSDPTIANRVERLYRAFLLRSGDPAGLAFWVDRIVAGAPMADVADSFVASAEFEQRYGDLDDAAFVDLLYRNVFDRPVDGPGRSYWLSVLARGASRGTVVSSISDSSEFVAATGTLPPRAPDEAALRRLYSSYFLREADGAGLTYWLDRHRSDSSLEEISQVFVASTEFDDLYGSLDDSTFIAMMYMNIFGRYPDAQGNNFWAQELRDGVPRGAMVLALSQSAEFVSLTTTRST